MADGFQTTAGASAFPEFAVHAHSGANEQGNRGDQAGHQHGDAEFLPGVFAELVGDEQTSTQADSHFGGGSHGGGGKILRKTI